MERKRTIDVQSSRKFDDLMLHDSTIIALSESGFHHPSPVQMQAIPQGRLGADLIVQAKSGTGKTLTFSIIVLERLKMEVVAPQALILAPTREIAIQSEQVIAKLSSYLPDEKKPSSAVFVGGLNIVSDEKKLRRLCHVVIGTPGRISSLISNGTLVPSKIAMFILDEADVLLSESLYTDVTWIYDQLPKRKQVMAYSATFTDELLADLEPLMKKPHRVMLCSETVSLEGVKQFYALVGVDAQENEEIDGDVEDRVFSEKVDKLIELLSSLSFHQAAVFCNKKPRAEWLASRLTGAGYPSAYLSSDRAQEERMEAMESVRGFKLRVIVSTDVMARGVDLDRVNVVANLDLPRDSATYVHRVGRTGRFGSLGVSVTYVTRQELPTLQSYLEEANAGQVMPLPAEIPTDMYSFELSSEWEVKALLGLQAAPRDPTALSPPPPWSKKASKKAEVPEQPHPAPEGGPVASYPEAFYTGHEYYSPHPYGYPSASPPNPWSPYPPNPGSPYPPNPGSPDPSYQPRPQHDPHEEYQRAYDWYQEEQRAQEEEGEEEEGGPASVDLDGHASDLIDRLDIKVTSPAPKAPSRGPETLPPYPPSQAQTRTQPHHSHLPPHHGPPPHTNYWGHPPYSPPPYAHHRPHFHPHPHSYHHGHPPHPHPPFHMHHQIQAELTEFFLQEWDRFRNKHDVWYQAWTKWSEEYREWRLQEENLEEVHVTL